jgi:hypothetical protein
VSATVVEVYRRVAHLLGELPHASAVLDTMLWLPRLAVREYIVTLTADSQLGVGELVAAGGFAELARLGLIDSRDGGVVMNDLTRALLRVLTGHRMVSAVARFLERCESESLPNHLRESMSAATDATDLHFLLLAAAAHADRHGQLWITYAGNLYLTSWATSKLAPGRQAGVYQVAPNECIAWQRGYPLFAEPGADVLEIAFVELTPERTIITDRYGRRRELTVEFARNVHKYRLIFNAALRLSGIYDDEPAWGFGAQFWPTPQDQYRHELVSVIPSLVATMHRVPVWATCGELFIPSEDHAMPGALPPCPRCAAYALNEDPLQSDTIMDLQAFCWALDPTEAQWAVLARIYSAYIVLAWESEGALVAAPEDVFTTESGDPRGVALFVPWVYASYAHFLLSADDPTDDMMSAGLVNLENAVEALNTASGQLSDIDIYFLAELLSELATSVGDVPWARRVLSVAEERLPQDDSEISRMLRDQTAAVHATLDGKTTD